MSKHNCPHWREAKEAALKVVAITEALDRNAYSHDAMMKAIKALQGHPKEVWVRSDWTRAGEKMQLREFNIVLPTTVTEVRIVGYFDASGAAIRARVQYMGDRDWEDLELTNRQEQELTEFCRGLDYTEKR